MTEVTGNTDESATVQQQTSLIEAFENTLEISQDFEQTECAASEETDGKQTSEQQDGQTVCAAAAEPSGTESKWGVGARCQVRWSEDGQVYLATVVSLDGERCRVHFNGYDNEEDVELSELRSPDGPHTHRHNPQDWGPGSRCRAVYSEDGLVYPAVVLWVKGQRCRIRFDDYNNEEEQDVDGLLRLDELRGPGRAAQGSSWKSSSIFDWKRRRRTEENQGERGGGGGGGGGGGERRLAWRDDQQSFSWQVKDKPGNQSKVEKEEKKRGNQQADGGEKPTNHSFPLFPPFPPPPQSSSGDPVSFLPPPPPPPPPPLWPFGGTDSAGSDATSSMLMLWYMCGFHTGSYLAQQMLRSSSKD